MATARRNGSRKGGKPGPATRGMAAVLCATLSGAPAWAQTTSAVSDLSGMRSATGQAELRARGYTLVHTDTSGEASWQYWWNGARHHCALVTMKDGKVDRLDTADEHDCNQQAAAQGETTPGISDGAKVAIGAAGLLGVLALLHKSHERKKDRSKSSEKDTAEYERGYRDGLYHQSYHNYNNHREYSDGYTAGSQKRSEETRYRPNEGHHSGYSPYVNVNDLVGARASGAEDDLRSRGFRNTSSYKADNRAHTYWWNSNTRQCLNASVRDGRMEGLSSTSASYCRK